MADLPQFAPIGRPPSLSALLVGQIREMIVTGRLALGEQLSENAIAEQLGVSRTPVREAFARLQAERLVEVKPQRGTFVFQYDARELREICELREVLETGALRVALHRDRGFLVAALRRQVEAAEAAADRGAQAYQAYDTAFHETLVAATDNQELTDAYERISGRVRAVRYRLTSSVEQVAVSQRRHREIVDAMAHGDDAAATALLGRHVYSSYSFFMQRIANKNPASPADAA
jgi:DNA-binding GntR family transcriptional regulator